MGGRQQKIKNVGAGVSEIFRSAPPEDFKWNSPKSMQFLKVCSFQNEGLVSENLNKKITTQPIIF